MSCERFAQDRLLHACGDLADPPAELLLHLETCADCAAEVGGIKDVRELYRSEPPPRPMRARRAPLAGLASLAAAVLVAVTGWFLMRPDVPAPVQAPAPFEAGFVDGTTLDGQIALLRARVNALRVPDDSF
jgi:hypothetical protein